MSKEKAHVGLAIVLIVVLSVSLIYEKMAVTVLPFCSTGRCLSCFLFSFSKNII